MRLVIHLMLLVYLYFLKNYRGYSNIYIKHFTTSMCGISKVTNISNNNVGYAEVNSSFYHTSSTWGSSGQKSTRVNIRPSGHMSYS